jgi:hypothetical protein
VLQDGPPERQSVRLRERVSGLLCWYHTAMEGLGGFVLRLPLGTLGTLTWLQNHLLLEKHITNAASSCFVSHLGQTGISYKPVVTPLYTHSIIKTNTEPHDITRNIASRTSVAFWPSSSWVSYAFWPAWTKSATIDSNNYRLALDPNPSTPTIFSCSSALPR